MTNQEGEEKVAQENVVFIEASAKEGHNIKTLFRRLAEASGNGKCENKQ